MFTKEMKAKMTLFTNTFEDASFSLFIDEEFDSTFYNLEFLMKFIIDEGFVIEELTEDPYYSHDMSVIVSKPKTSKEIIDEGLSFKEINKFMKEQEESIQCQYEFLEDLEDDFQAYNEKTPETTKMISAIMEGMEKSAEWNKKATSLEPKKFIEPVGCGGLSPFIIRPMTEKEKDEIDKLFGISGLNLGVKEVK